MELETGRLRIRGQQRASNTEGQLRRLATGPLCWRPRATPGRAARAGVALCLAFVLPSCRSSPVAFGATPAMARAQADELFGGLEQRFTAIDRSPTAAAALARIERAVFTPSKVYDDSSLWTTEPSDTVRGLTLAGHFVRDHYVVAENAHAPPTEQLAASRDEIRLTRVGHGEFEWTTSIDQALGSVRPDDIDRVVGSMLSAAATSDSAALRAGSMVAFPKSRVVLGRLFSIDSVRRVGRDDGTAAVHLSFGLHPDGLAESYPAFAAYLRSYLGPTRLHCALRDSTGGDWLVIALDKGRLDLRLRADREGHFAPLEGARRPMPDSLALDWDFRTKVWMFSLGLSDLASDFVVLHTDRTRGWRIGFRREPHWHFPLAVDHLLKTSLRRPFADAGAHYRMVVTDSGAGTTRFVRDGRVVVREGVIMRWLGGLAARALGDFTGPAEAQESAYLAAVFRALRADVDADLPATATGDVEAPPGR